ncbi:MAG TPA: M1 family aminopeptidase, partial [Tenuifilaceae bacterium]|nr:M1 family aminopeptidase [Tenuifilaceae bacterium]
MIKQLFSVKSITVALVLLLAISCSKTPELGVSKELAAIRRENISNIDYSIYMSVPSHVESNIPSRVEISFELKKRQRVVLDYRMNDSSLKSVTVNSRVYNTKPENGHIVIPAWYLYKGANRVDIDFYAGESSLNRKKDFLYTLLVPDRASTVFPCFDQPDMKAIFNLTLEVPKDWTAVTNSAAENAMQTDTSNIFMFGKTQPLSTYLFAFAAGKFDTISRTENNRKIVLYHRENDLKKVERNLDAIFSSHFHSLNWLESYTGIPYPFDKLDIVLIPDFQYSGMEHSGAIFYRDARLLLDENPSVNQKLGQANLIAHEVAHQWFGNLVTMRWFNDVWLKEVFAGLMADKIVNPQFPEVNHQLSF